MSIVFEHLAIPEVILIRPQVFEDARGFFLETYKASVYQEAGITDSFVQDNHSRSSSGILRGLHYQKDPKAQAKLVSVAYGKVLDVAVDIRIGSPTYGQWVSAILSDENHHQLYVPVGFAHGFYVLSDVADLVYKVSEEYSKAHDRGIAWDDPEIAISWGTEAPLLSSKDRAQPTLAEADNNFVYTKKAL